MKRLALIALLLPFVAVTAKAQDIAADQKTYCAYLVEQAKAEADQLRTPVAIGGLSQPSSGTPAQVYGGAQGSVAGIRKASATLALANSSCKLYAATEDATLRIQSATTQITKEALVHRLVLIEQADATLDGLIAEAKPKADAHNLTHPALYALQTAKVKLQMDRSTTERSIALLYVPEGMTATPVKELVIESRAAQDAVASANNRLTRAGNWDFTFDGGMHREAWDTTPLIGTKAANYGAFVEGTFSWNFASKKINRHLDTAAGLFGDWKRVQEGDIVRTSEVLKRQVEDSIAANTEILEQMNAEYKVIEDNIAIVQTPDTSNAYAFYLLVKVDELSLRIEIGDTQYRLDTLKQYLAENF